MKKILTLLTMMIVWASAHAQSPTWHPADSSMAFDGDVKYVTNYDSTLTAFGEFSGHMAQMREGIWITSEAPPAFTAVTSIEFNGEWWIGGTESPYLAKWNGSTWTSPINLNGKVNNLCVFDGKLYIGGVFSLADGQSTSNIISYDGNNTNVLSGGVTGDVQSLNVYDGLLLIGESSLGPSGAKIEAWDGTNFVPFIQPANAYINEAVVFNSLILFEGMITNPDDGSGWIHRIVYFNGIEWHNFCDLSGDVRSFYVDSNSLLIAGPFDSINSNPISNIARFTDGVFEQIGAPIFGWINSVCLNNNGEVVIGGKFSETYGGFLTPNVLIFSEESPTGGTDAVETENLSGVTLFPNPASDIIQISGLPSTKTDIDIYDVTGRRVAHYVAMQKATLNVSGLPNGMYLIRTPNSESRFIKQ